MFQESSFIMPRRKYNKSKSKPKTRRSSSQPRRLKKKSASPRRQRRRRVTFRGLSEEMEQFEAWFLQGLEDDEVTGEYVRLAMLENRRLKENIHWPTENVTKALNKLKKKMPRLFEMWSESSEPVPELAILHNFEDHIQHKEQGHFLYLFNKLFKNIPPELDGPYSHPMGKKDSDSSLGSLDEELSNMNLAPMTSLGSFVPSSSQRKLLTIVSTDEFSDDDDNSGKRRRLQ